MMAISNRFGKIARRGLFPPLAASRSLPPDAFSNCCERARSRKRKPGLPWIFPMTVKKTIIFLVILAMTAGTARAQDDEPTYRGKTVAAWKAILKKGDPRQRL